jgi:hypothetical protein
MAYLDPEYVINLDSGVSVFVKPYGFPELIKSLHAQFEQGKISRSLENPTLDDDERLKIFSASFKQLTVINYNLTMNSVIKVVDESKGIDVTDREFIKEFLQNIDKVSADKITDLIKEINLIGIKKTFTAKCDACGHEWENDIDFNPVNFL